MLKKKVKNEAVILRLNGDDKRFLESHAKAAGVSLSEFIRHYTLTYLKKPVTVHLSEASISTLIGYAGYFNVSVEDLLIMGAMSALEDCYELERVPRQMLEKIEEAKEDDRCLDRTKVKELKERFPDMKYRFDKPGSGKGDTILTGYNKK